MKHRSEIDGLRALAVLPVVLYHAGYSIFQGGYIGVDIFFVISGYLITALILEEINLGKFSLFSFYERRVRRLLPALFVMMFVCIPFAWHTMAPSDLKDFGQSLIAVSLFVSNILFWRESNYFSDSSELKPLIHTWSLGVEEQFYILFPIVLTFFWFSYRKLVVPVLIIAFFASLLIAEWGAFNKPIPNFFLLPTRGWELILGIFAALLIHSNYTFKNKLLNELFSLLGMALIVISIIYFDENTPHPSLYTLAPTMGCFLIILCSKPQTIIGKFLSHKILVGIGLISYSLYLWHQPIFAFFEHRFLDYPSNQLVVTLIALSVFIAYLSWKFIEKPFRDLSQFSSRKVFALSFVGILFFTSVGVLLDQTDGVKARTGFDETMMSSFARADVSDCFGKKFNHEAQDWGCYLGGEKAKPDYILFGDSHSIAHVQTIDQIAKSRNIQIFFTGSAGCVPFLDIYPQRYDQVENNCKKLNDRVLSFAKENTIKGILLFARWSYYTYGDYTKNGAQLISNKEDGPFTLNDSIASFREGFQKTVDQYKAANITLHVFSQVPQQLKNPENYFFKLNRGFGSIDELSIPRLQFEELEKIPRELFTEYSNDINFHYLADIFCENDICPFGTNEYSFYVDDDHINHIAAARLAPVLQTILLNE